MHLGARIIGHAAWWVFVVATLFAGGITWLGNDHDYQHPPFLLRSDGWMVYSTVPDSSSATADYVDVAVALPYEWWRDGELLSAAMFVVVMIAAVVEATAARRLWRGLITVGAPCVALGLLVIATPDTDAESDMTAALVLVLVAVTVREVWARCFAPRTV
ncbi:MAG: hypothetical protein DI630_09245 [Gordonia sp. (in: high G+C Gram-positive bacteria)]|nr:MAG: hypothetical protein DI630_09245 [Gordonia sp. (in: high G+C Gram-positive bacteria)]